MVIFKISGAQSWETSMLPTKWRTLQDLATLTIQTWYAFKRATVCVVCAVRYLVGWSVVSDTVCRWGGKPCRRYV